MSTQADQISPELLKYMQDHASDDLRPNVIACSVTTSVLATFFVALRLAGRRLSNGKWFIHTSDWLLIVALVFIIASASVFAWTTQFGAGRHIIFATDGRMLQILSIVAEICYGSGMGFLKLSILSLYLALFPSQRFQYVVWGMIAFTISWIMVAVFGAIFQCVPVEYAWNQADHPDGYCTQHGIMQLVITVCNIVTDFVILAMPIPIIRKLKVSQEKKKLLIFTFCMGGSVCIISIVRLVYSLQAGTLDGSWTAMPAYFVSATELLVGVFVISIPTYRPFYFLLIYGSVEHTSKSTSNRWYRYQKTSHSDSYRMDIRHNTNISANTTQPHQMSGINVINDVALVTHKQMNGNWVRVNDDDQELLYTPHDAMTDSAGSERALGR